MDNFDCFEKTCIIDKEKMKLIKDFWIKFDNICESWEYGGNKAYTSLYIGFNYNKNLNTFKLTFEIGSGDLCTIGYLLEIEYDKNCIKKYVLENNWDDYDDPVGAFIMGSISETGPLVVLEKDIKIDDNLQLELDNFSKEIIMTVNKLIYEAKLNTDEIV